MMRYAFAMLAVMAMTHDDIKIKEGYRAAAIGQTGTGKSFLSLKALIPKTGRLCIIDPKREIEYPGVKVYHRMAAIEFWQPKRFIYQPTVEDVDKVSAYNQVMKWCFERGGYFMFVDDIAGLFNEKKQYPAYLAKLYQLGRSRGITILSCFQRPAHVPGYLTSEAQQFYVFRLMRAYDKEQVADWMGEYDESKLKGPYQFYYRDIRDFEQEEPRILSINLT